MTAAVLGFIIVATERDWPEFASLVAGVLWLAAYFLMSRDETKESRPIDTGKFQFRLRQDSYADTGALKRLCYNLGMTAEHFGQLFDALRERSPPRPFASTHSALRTSESRSGPLE